MGNILKLENIFKEINNNTLSFRNNYLKYHNIKCDNIDVPENVKSLFFKSRLYFRIRNLNKILIQEKNEKRKLKKTIT